MALSTTVGLPRPVCPSLSLVFHLHVFGASWVSGLPVEWPQGGTEMLSARPGTSVALHSRMLCLFRVSSYREAGTKGEAGPA